MRQWQLRRGTAVIALVCLSLIASGCIGRGVSGVDVKALAADLVFGIPPLPEAVAPPDTFTDPTDPKPLQRGAGANRDFRGRREFAGFAGGECPAAPEDEFPDEVASTSVPSMPKEGAYKWAVKGSQTLRDGSVFELPTIVTRQIQNVRKRDFGHSFETVQNEMVAGSGAKITQFWEARTTPPETGQRDVRGLYLTVIQSKRGSDAATEFDPNPDLMFLKIPVVTGAAPVGPPPPAALPVPVDRPANPTTPNGQLDTVGSDPTGESIRHRGTILEQVDIDACGEKTRGWFVNAEQEITSRKDPTTNDPAPAENYVRNYDYVVSTNMGGIVIFEYVETPAESPVLTYEANIGQLEPTVDE